MHWQANKRRTHDCMAYSDILARTLRVWHENWLYAQKAYLPETGYTDSVCRVAYRAHDGTQPGRLSAGAASEYYSWSHSPREVNRPSCRNALSTTQSQCDHRRCG